MVKKILAFDTTAQVCSAALLIGDEITRLEKLAPQKHAQLILPMIEELLVAAKLSIHDLDAIAFANGPGSFTGIRIAAGIGQGLAFAVNIPIIAVSSLQALAQRGYKEFGEEKILAAFDARMDEIYFGVYELRNNGIMVAVRSEVVCAAGAASLPAKGDWFAIGDGWQGHEKLLTSKLQKRLLGIEGTSYPRAIEVAELAAYDYRYNKLLEPQQALPVYLRAAVL